jgi:hypothetical protein
VRFSSSAEIHLLTELHLPLKARWGPCMRIKSINEEAEKLVSELGAIAALEAVHAEIKKAKRTKNHRLEMYKLQVALAVSRLAGSVTAKAG